MIRRSWKRVRRWAYARGELFTGGRVLGPALAGARELVLQPHERDDLGDGSGRHPGSRHFPLRVVDSRISGRHTGTGNADQEGHTFCPDRSQRQDPSRLAYTNESDFRMIEIAACLQVSESSHRVAGTLSE